MRQVVKEGFASAQTLSAHIATTSGKHVSAQTIRNVLHNAQLCSRTPRKNPFISERSRQRRLEFAKTYLKQTAGTNTFAALENFDDNVDMNRAWENSRESIKSSAKESLCHYELRQLEPWFDYEFSKLRDRRKQAKMQWLVEL
jgi:hypothetical protein